VIVENPNLISFDTNSSDLSKKCTDVNKPGNELGQCTVASQICVPAPPGGGLLSCAAVPPPTVPVQACAKRADGTDPVSDCSTDKKKIVVSERYNLKLLGWILMVHFWLAF
jgi:hypothetical protein